MKLKVAGDALGISAVFAVLVIVLSILVKGFATADNFKILLLSVTTVGLLACTMLFCLAGGDFDLSIGSTAALSGVLGAMLMSKFGNVWLAIGAPMALGALIGTFNGVIIARIGINALITTLATMQIVRGAARIATEGSTVSPGSSNTFEVLGNGRILGISNPIWFMILAFVGFGLLLNRTVFGRNTLAIGGNSEAARLAGIPVVRTKILIFALQGAMAAFAGLLVASRVQLGEPNALEGLELQVISACVLGGVSLTGGIGSITGVIVGVLIMGSVQNAMTLMGIPPFWQLVVSGAILLAAVLFDKLKTRRSW